MYAAEIGLFFPDEESFYFEPRLRVVLEGGVIIGRAGNVSERELTASEPCYVGTRLIIPDNAFSQSINTTHGELRFCVDGLSYRQLGYGRTLSWRPSDGYAPDCSSGSAVNLNISPTGTAYLLLGGRLGPMIIEDIFPNGSYYLRLRRFSGVQASSTMP